MTFTELQNQKDIPVIIADGEGYIVSINKPFQTAFGWETEHLAGKPLTTIIPEVLREAHHMGFSRHLQTGRSTVLGSPVDLAVLLADGSETVATHHILAGDIGGKRHFAASIIPITQG